MVLVPYISIYLADGDIRSIVFQSSCENISWEDKLLLEKNYEGGFWLGIEELGGIYYCVGLCCKQHSWKREVFFTLIVVKIVTD